MPNICDYDLVFCTKKLVVFEVSTDENVSLLLDCLRQQKTSCTPAKRYGMYGFLLQCRISNYPTMKCALQMAQKLELVHGCGQLSDHSAAHLEVIVLKVN